MCDWSAERRLRRSFRVDVNELMVVGGVRELIDAFLGDLDPGGGLQLGADQPWKFLDFDCLSSLPLALVCVNRGRTEVFVNPKTSVRPRLVIACADSKMQNGPRKGPVLFSLLTSCDQSKYLRTVRP